MGKRTSRRALLFGCGASVVGLAGCGEIEEELDIGDDDVDDTEYEDNGDSEGTVESNGDDENGESITEQEDEETDATETSDVEQEDTSSKYDADFDIDSLVIAVEELPEGFFLFEETTDEGEGDEDMLLFQERRFLREEDNSELISSAATVFENAEAAEVANSEHINSITNAGGVVVTDDTGFSIETTVVEDESTGGERVRYYYGRDSNLLVKIMFIGLFDVEFMNDLYVQNLSLI